MLGSGEPIALTGCPVQSSHGGVRLGQPPGL